MVRLVASLVLLTISSICTAASPLNGKWEGEAASDLWPTFLRIEIGEGDHAPATLFVLGQTVDLGPLKNAETLDSLLGEGADALHMQARVENDHLVGTMSQSGKSFGFSLQRVPNYPATNDRVVGWSRDLDAVRDEVLTFDRSFDAAEKGRARHAIEQLRADLPRLSDDAVLVGLARIAAIANNAHTRLYFLRNRTEVRRMPLRVWWFGKELRVVRAAPSYAHYLGCRIDRIGGLSSAAAKAKVDGLFAGSPTWRTYMSGYSLTSGDVLHGVGIAATAERVRYRFTDCGRFNGSESIASLPLTRSAKPLESWWDLAPHYAGAADDWKQVLGADPENAPLYLRHPDRNFWFDAGALGGPFYIQYNRAADAADESMSRFADRAGDAIATSKPAAIIVDLRFNTGGNGSLTPKLVDAVKRAPAATPVYVVTGRTTFSAGIVATALLREARHVTIVGEPVGDALDFWAEGGNIILPYSGLYVHFANGAHSLSPKPCPTKAYCDDLNVASLAPDIQAPLTWAAYRARLDPALDSIRRDILNSGPKHH
jgi:hypothetical protein